MNLRHGETVSFRKLTRPSDCQHVRIAEGIRTVLVRRYSFLCGGRKWPPVGIRAQGTATLEICGVCRPEASVGGFRPRSCGTRAEPMQSRSNLGQLEVSLREAPASLSEQETFGPSPVARL